jgi:hypothetical protein
MDDAEIAWVQHQLILCLALPLPVMSGVELRRAATSGLMQQTATPIDHVMNVHEQFAGVQFVGAALVNRLGLLRNVINQ